MKHKYIVIILMMLLVVGCSTGPQHTEYVEAPTASLPQLARFQGDSTSREAVEFYLPQLAGVNLAQLMPPFTPNGRTVYLGAPDNILMVFYYDSVISDDVYDSYARRLYDLSESIADDRKIFRGYEIVNDSTEAFAPYSYDDYSDNSPMLGWGFRRNGRVVRMYPELKNVDRDTFNIHYICVRVSTGLD